MAQTTNTGTADAVRAELARQRVTGRELSAVARIPERTLRRRLSGETPFTAEEIAAVARFLKVPVDALIGINEDEQVSA